MRTIEKINRNRRQAERHANAVCKWLRREGGAPKTKRESINLPSSIGWGLKIAFVIAGYCIWGVEFTWVVLGLIFCWRILKSIASCLMSLICLIGFFWFLFTYIF